MIILLIGVKVEGKENKVYFLFTIKKLWLMVNMPFMCHDNNLLFFKVNFIYTMSFFCKLQCKKVFYWRKETEINQVF